MKRSRNPMSTGAKVALGVAALAAGGAVLYATTRETEATPRKTTGGGGDQPMSGREGAFTWKIYEGYVYLPWEVYEGTRFIARDSEATYQEARNKIAAAIAAAKSATPWYFWAEHRDEYRWRSFIQNSLTKETFEIGEGIWASSHDAESAGRQAITDRGGKPIEGKPV